MKKIISLTLSQEVIKKVEKNAIKESRSKSQVIDLVLRKYYKIGDKDENSD